MVRAQNDIYMVTADAASNSSKDNTAEGLADGRLTRAQLMRNAANICCFLLRSVAMETVAGQRGRGMHGASQTGKHRRALETADRCCPAELPDRSRRRRLNFRWRSCPRRKVLVRYTSCVSGTDGTKLVFRMSSTLDPLQVPISVFLNKHVCNKRDH